MSWARNLPLSRKYTYAFGVVCALCLGLGVYTFAIFHTIARDSTEVSGNHLPSLINIGEIRDGVNTERREDLELMLCQTQACTADHAARRKQAISQYQTALKAMDPLIIPEERAHFEQFVYAIKTYQDASDRGVALLTSGKAGDGLDVLSSETVTASLGTALAAAHDGFQVHTGMCMERSEAVTSAGNRATWVIGGMTLLLVSLCALIGIALTRVTAPRIGRAKALAQRLAEKDLTAHVAVTGTDEIGQLDKALNESVAVIRSVVQSVAHGVDTLSAASTQISTRSVESAGNARTESGKINQIAAAAQEMTATIGEISHNAENAAKASREFGPDRRAGRRRDASRGGHHGKNCRRHPNSLRQDDTARRPVAGDWQSCQRHPGNQRADQPAGPECGHRSGARRRAWARLRGCGWRGSPPGRTHQERYRGDREHHPQHSGRRRRAR